MPGQAPSPQSKVNLSGLPAYPNPPSDSKARAVITADADGEVQLIAPERSLLDLNAVRRHLGRKLRARPYDVDHVTSAVPGAYELPVVLDQRLAEAADVALATEEPGKYVRCRGTDLLDGYFDTRVVPMCEPISTDPTPRLRDGDQQQINDSVSRFTERRLQERLDQTLHIPPLPEAARRIVALQADPNYDLDDLVQIVETDPSIAARIMGWANSAFYHADPPAKSIKDAIMRVLGFDTVLAMALGMALGDTLRLPKAHVSGLPPYWVDAVFTAATMEALARRQPSEGRPQSGLSYLTGLLANFGTLVVGHVFPPQYESICMLQEANRHVPHSHADQAVLQLPREMIASALLELWALPQPVCDAVRFQLAAEYTGANASYVQLLRFTRQALGNQGITDFPVEPLTDLDSDALGLSRPQVQEVLTLIGDSRDELDGFATAMSH